METRPKQTAEEANSSRVACSQVEKGLLGRKSGKGFYLYPKGKKGSKGGKELNPEAVSIIKPHQKADGAGASMAPDVIQDRLMCR